MNLENFYKIPKSFSVMQTLDCGQCFRFEKIEENNYIIVAHNRVLELVEDENYIYLSCTPSEYMEIWEEYFDVNRDYDAIRTDFITDDFTKAAADFGSGIHILKQEEWEALASFIISQCNNIPRIKNIIHKLSTSFGQEIIYKDKSYFTFPSATVIAKLSLEDLAVLKAGYRSEYLLLAANAVVNGDIDFKALKVMDLPTSRKKIMENKGIGAKVADCFLLFGMGKMDAFPVDTWMKKAKKFYSGDMSGEKYGKYAGIYQQYIFYYAKENKIGNTES